MQHFFLFNKILKELLDFRVMSIQKIKRKSKPFLVRIKTVDGKNISATFATRSEAEEFELIHKKEKILPEELHISASERVDMLRIKKLCSKFDLSLHDVLPLFQNLLKNYTKTPLSLKEAQKQFLAYLESKKVRPRTYDFYMNHLQRFSKFCEINDFQTVATFTKESAQTYIDSAKSKPQAKRALHAYWAYLHDSGYASSNVFHTVKIKKILQDKPAVTVMSVKETIENIAAIRPEFKPLYALMAFAGIRPEELIVDKSRENAKKDWLKFLDIDFDRKKIVIRASVSKTREERIITGLPNIWPFLEPIKEWGAIYPETIKMRRKIGRLETTDNVYQQWRKEKEKLPHKIPQDALRHTFASYAYHALGVERAVEILGHDYKVYKRFYKGRAEPEDSRKYFEIAP